MSLTVNELEDELYLLDSKLSEINSRINVLLKEYDLLSRQRFSLKIQLELIR